MGYYWHAMGKERHVWRTTPYKDMSTEEDQLEDKEEDGLQISWNQTELKINETARINEDRLRWRNIPLTADLPGGCH